MSCDHLSIVLSFTGILANSESNKTNYMKVVIIDYGSGNLHSALKAFERVAIDDPKASRVELTSDARAVMSADRIVLPGVGAFADCLGGLSSLDGMLDALHETVRVKQRPFLGICVGMQLMADTGLEHGKTTGLGWISGQVEAIRPADKSLKIPHMGWNTLNVVRPHPLLSGIETGSSGWHAYFVHSYHFKTADSTNRIAETDYGGPVTAMVGFENMAGTQFHPEKSQRLGLRLISNFLNWNP